MQSSKALWLIPAAILLIGCQAEPLTYEVAAVVKPVRFSGERGLPRQYEVEITVTETNRQGESRVISPRILTVVGKPAEIVTEELHTNQPPGRIACTARILHEAEGPRVDTAVTIVKKGKEVCSLQQSTVFAPYGKVPPGDAERRP